MADIDLYNSHQLGCPFSSTLETRIFNPAIKLRAYGFIEEAKEPPYSATDSHAKRARQVLN
jgi:hypothetical protein